MARSNDSDFLTGMAVLYRQELGEETFDDIVDLAEDELAENDDRWWTRELLREEAEDELAEASLSNTFVDTPYLSSNWAPDAEDLDFAADDGDPPCALCGLPRSAHDYDADLSNEDEDEDDELLTTWDEQFPSAAPN